MDRFTKILIAFATLIGLSLLVICFMTFSKFLLNHEPVTLGADGNPVSGSKTGSGPDGLSRAGPDANGKDQPLPPRPVLSPEVTKYRLSPRSPFYDLNADERNRIWWEIAGVGQRKRGDDLAFTLNVDQVNALARKYNCTTIEVFEFFRAGKDSDWVRFDDVE